MQVLCTIKLIKGINIMLKKLLLTFISLFLLVGCSSSKEETDPDSVSSIRLESMTSEYYKGEPIEILMEVDSDYQLTEDDFNIFGGSISIKNKHTAFVTYNSAGTFHLSCAVGDVKSNELTFQVRTNTSSIGTSSKPSSNKPSSNNSLDSTEPQKKDPNDFTDWENVRDASDDKVTSADDFYANQDSYMDQEILLEGVVPQGSDGTFITTSDNQEIPLSGLEMNYAGPVRLYGSYDGETFHVRSYVSFGGETLETDKKDE